MARVMGVDLPKNKKIWVALTYIYGVGKYLSYVILNEAQIDPNKKVNELNEDDTSKINSIIVNNFKVEGDLKRDVGQNIKRLVEINTYRGARHKRSLPCRGQRTRTNARTRRGKRMGIRVIHAAPAKTQEK